MRLFSSKLQRFTVKSRQSFDGVVIVVVVCVVEVFEVVEVSFVVALVKGVE